MSRSAPEGTCECLPSEQGSYCCNYCCEMILWAHEELYGAEDDCLLRSDESEWEDEEELCAESTSSGT